MSGMVLPDLVARLAGYPRFAASLKDIADSYDRDADRIANQHKDGD